MTRPPTHVPVVTRTPEALEAEAAQRQEAALLLDRVERERMAAEQRQLERDRAEKFRRSHR